MRRDAAALACVCKAAAAAPPTSKWHSAVRVEHGGAGLEPASGAFNVTVAPGEDVQAAVDACPPGGCVLLLPGTHAGPLVLTADKEVHVFGRGRATLRASSGNVVTSEAAAATLDGLIIIHEAGGSVDGVWIQRGKLRVQACDVTSLSGDCVFIGGGDPVLTSCKYARGRARSRFLFFHESQ